MSAQALWLDQVGNQWPVRRLKDHAKIINGYPFDSQYFNHTTGTRLIRIRDLADGTEPTYVAGAVPDEAVIDSGDIVVGMDGDFNVVTWQGGRAALNQRLCVLRAQPSLDQRFLRYVLPMPLKAIHDITYFTTVKHLSSIDLLDERIPLPPLQMQKAIAGYLDRETARIDALIAAKRRLVELLEERRVVRLNAVWESLRRRAPLKRLIAHEKDALIAGPFGSDLAGADIQSEGPCAVFDQGVVINETFENPKNYINSEKASELIRFAVRPEDVLVTGRGTIGKAIVVPRGVGLGVIHPCLLRVRVDRSRFLPEFLVAYLRWSARAQEVLRLESTATTIEVIYSGTLRELPVPDVSIVEQDALLKTIVDLVSKVRAPRESLGDQIGLLYERRQALVAAAVTGRLDIPEAA